VRGAVGVHGNNLVHMQRLQLISLCPTDLASGALCCVILLHCDKLGHNAWAPLTLSCRYCCTVLQMRGAAGVHGSNPMHMQQMITVIRHKGSVPA
jgi:hypothetical protein